MKIRRRVNPSGAVVWQLDKGEGKGGRKSYPTKAEAEDEMEAEMERRSKHGRMIDGITPEEMAEVVTARSRLLFVGATISEAVEFFLAHGKHLHEEVLLPELVTRFRWSRAEIDLSKQYIKQLKCSLGSLAVMYPLLKAHELTSRQVLAWIRSGEWEPKTRQNYLGDVSAMFEWALQPTQGFARINPCVGVQREPKKRRGKTAALTVEQSQQLLEEAVRRGWWRMVAYLVVSLFGGLRPEEATYPGFTWREVDLEERHVFLTEDVVKTGPGRVVDLTENAVAWLKLIPEEQRKAGPVVPLKNWAMHWKWIRHDLGWRVCSEKVMKKQCLKPVEPVHGEWPNDVLRHTYASMHYAHHQNEALLQVQMGHRSAKMLHQHYRAVKSRKEAALFWELKPVGGEA